MRLYARMLADVASPNQYRVVNRLDLSKGEAGTVVLQLVDASQDRSDQGFSPAGRRYCPPATSTLQVTLESIDEAKKYSRAAAQPYVGDASLWSFQVLATDDLKGTVSLSLALTEPVVGGTVTKKAFVQAAIAVAPTICDETTHLQRGEGGIA